MIKFVENKTVIVGFLISVYVLAFICLSLPPPLDLLAQQRGTISVIQATALPLVNTEGNQVKVIINYSIGDQSIVGQRINAQMGIYDRVNGTLIKLSSFPDGFILNDTAGTIQLASTLNDPKIQNISTIIALTNEGKTEKYSNNIRSDLDLSAILPTSLPISTINETSLPPPTSSPTLPPPLPQSLQPGTIENNGEDGNEDSTDDDSDSDEGE
jgi:hypothetical protein